MTWPIVRTDRAAARGLRTGDALRVAAAIGLPLLVAGALIVGVLAVLGRLAQDGPAAMIDQTGTILLFAPLAIWFYLFLGLVGFLPLLRLGRAGFLPTLALGAAVGGLIVLDDTIRGPDYAPVQHVLFVVAGVLIAGAAWALLVRFRPDALRRPA